MIEIALAAIFYCPSANETINPNVVYICAEKVNKENKSMVRNYCPTEQDDLNYFYICAERKESTKTYKWIKVKSKWIKVNK